MLWTKDNDRTSNEITMQLCVFERNSKQPSSFESTDHEASYSKPNKSKHNFRKGDTYNY